MTKRIAIFGSSFNPPGVYHRNAVKMLLAYRRESENSVFIDRVIVRPCGPRPDKESTNDLLPIHRATMTSMTFRGLEDCHIDLSDLEKDVFTPAIEVLAEYYDDPVEVWLVVEGGYVAGGRKGSSAIHKWHRGAELWKKARFIVLASHQIDPRDLPPRHIVLPVADLQVGNLARDIRSMVFSSTPIDAFVVPQVRDYIKRHRLYRGSMTGAPVKTFLDLQRPLIVLDNGPTYVNKEAIRIAEKLGFPTEDVDNPTCVIVLGGDGRMMRAVRERYNLRAPFFGINVGHRGYHLNNITKNTSPESLRKLLRREVILYHMPMLSVEYQDSEGEWHSALAYQDAYLHGGLVPLWIRMTENGKVRFKRLICDVALVSLPVGSTGYAKAMGAQMLPADARVMTFAVSCWNDYSSDPYHPRGLNMDTVIEFENLQPERRTPKAIADGVVLGDAHTVRIRVSRTASAEVAFLKGHDFMAKIR